MSAITPLVFDETIVRVVTLEGEPWFVGRDVAGVLGYADPTNAMKQHCRGVVKRHPILNSLGRTQEVRILSEPDVLRLIMSSRQPAAMRALLRTSLQPRYLTANHPTRCPGSRRTLRCWIFQDSHPQATLPLAGGVA